MAQNAQVVSMSLRGARPWRRGNPRLATRNRRSLRGARLWRRSTATPATSTRGGVLAVAIPLSGPAFQTLRKWAGCSRGKDTVHVATSFRRVREQLAASAAWRSPSRGEPAPVHRTGAVHRTGGRRGRGRPPRKTSRHPTTHHRPPTTAHQPLPTDPDPDFVPQKKFCIGIGASGRLTAKREVAIIPGMPNPGSEP